MKNLYSVLLSIDNLKVEENVNLKEYTTYKIEATGKYLCRPMTEESLLQLLKLLKENKYPYRILGGGSNLIFKNNFYEGVLIKLDAFDSLKIKDNNITVGAGYSTQKLALKASRMGLTGMEFATGVPGTIGGAIYNNSGCYNSDMGYIVKSIKVITPDLKIETMTNDELEFHYRTSYLKKHPGFVCLEITIQLSFGDASESLELIKDRRERRMKDQPLEFPSAGSVFRNPIGNYAGKLIEDIGYKGKKIGMARVSEKHANFIVTENGVKGEDIVTLIQEIKEKIHEKYNIDLILEQEIIE